MSDKSEESGILITAAKAVGAAAGKLAAVAKHAKPEPPKGEAAGESTIPDAVASPAQTPKPAKFAPSHKSRLPRKLKKAQKKAAAKALAKRSA